ncbi:hypothetical protein ACVOMV_28035 (plasmid) [Mesorhizobium atlanticum]
MPALDILVLTQDNCRFCEDAKLLFQRLAGEFPLSVAMLDINSPKGQELAAQGGILVPAGHFHKWGSVLLRAPLRAEVTP